MGENKSYTCSKPQDQQQLTTAASRCFTKGNIPNTKMTPPSGIARCGLRTVPNFEEQKDGAGGRKNIPLQPSIFQQAATNTFTDTDPISRLANILEKNTNISPLKLPPIDIGIFDGNPLNWINWWPKYKAFIHSRRDLDANTKFLYLQSFLTENAAKELWGASPETLPYHTAINILFEKFADQELLAGVYRDQLKNIPLPESAVDIPGIRNFVDEVRKYMNCLWECKHTPETYSLSTMDFYRLEMPEDLLHKIADQEGRRISTLNLEHFITALLKYVDIREDTSRFREYVIA